MPQSLRRLRAPSPPAEPARAFARALTRVALASALVACVTVKPQQRAVLADPVMQFDGEARAEALRVHALDNREGSFGGSGVAGGGCGCN